MTTPASPDTPNASPLHPPPEDPLQVFEQDDATVSMPPPSQPRQDAAINPRQALPSQGLRREDMLAEPRVEPPAVMPETHRVPRAPITHRVEPPTPFPPTDAGLPLPPTMLPWARHEGERGAGVPDFVVRNTDTTVQFTERRLSAEDAPRDLLHWYHRKIAEFEWLQDGQLTIIGFFAVLSGVLMIGSMAVSPVVSLLGILLLQANVRWRGMVRRVTSLRVFLGLLLPTSVLVWALTPNAWPVTLPFFLPTALLLPFSASRQEVIGVMDWGVLRFAAIVFGLLIYMVIMINVVVGSYFYPVHAAAGAFGTTAWLGLVALAWQERRAGRLIAEVIAHLPTAAAIAPEEPRLRRLTYLKIWLGGVKTQARETWE